MLEPQSYEAPLLRASRNMGKGAKNGALGQHEAVVLKVSRTSDPAGDILLMFPFDGGNEDAARNILPAHLDPSL